MTLLSFGIYLVLCVGAGLAISLQYGRLGHRFLSMLDMREFPLALFVYLVAAPTIWTLYACQPRWILQVFEDLSESGVIVRREQTTTVEGFVRQTVCLPLSRAHHSAIAVSAGVVGVLTVVLTAYPAFYQYFFGFPTIWFLINPVYLWVVWIPAVLFVPVYMVAWLVIRQALAIKGLYQVYGAFQLIPKPFHPDRCNGLAPVGDYAIRTAYAAVFFGTWVFIMTLFPTFFRVLMRLDYTTVLPMILYPVLVPALLIGPVWGTHVAMRKAKLNALETVAVQMRTLLSETNTALLSQPEAETAAALVSVIAQLEKKHQLIAKEYRTWPFSMPRVGRFSIAAAVPWLYYGASILWDVYG